MLVLLHAGGAKGKGLLDAARKAGAREVVCPKMTKPADRLAFVRTEFRAAGRSATPEACQALVDALGSDLRELASACSQLAADVEGPIDEAVVARYYTGRAEATGFEVADLAVTGRTAEALERLRWALAVGQPLPGITFALASGVRSIGKLATAPRGARPGDLARDLGMPPWKIDRVRQQMRGWSADGWPSRCGRSPRRTPRSRAAAPTPRTRWRRPWSPSAAPPAPAPPADPRLHRPRTPPTATAGPGPHQRLPRAPHPTADPGPHRPADLRLHQRLDPRPAPTTDPACTNG